MILEILVHLHIFANIFTITEIRTKAKQY